MLYDPRRSVSCGIVHGYASLCVARHGSVAWCMRLHVARPSAMLNVLYAQLEARLPRHVVALDWPCQRNLAHAVRWAARHSHLPRSRLDLFPLRSIRSKTRGPHAELQRLRYSNGTPGTPTAVAARGGVPAVDRARVHQIGREHVKRDGDARHGAEPERAPMEPDTWRCDATRRLQCCIECPFRRVAAVISTNSADTADGNGLSTRALAPALA